MLENAQWIKSPVNEEEKCYVFYRDFKAEKDIKKATLTVTAMGLYMAFVNGTRVEKGILNPGWTSYDRAVQCQTIDVTEQIKNENNLSVVTAEGWAIGYIKAGNPFRNHYAENIAVMYSLDIEYIDGTYANIVSDTDTKVKTSHIIDSSIYHGETVDKTAEITELGNALIDSGVITNPVPVEGEYVTEHERINAVQLIVTPKGEKVIDFGQNLAGYVEVKVKAKKGDRITISHAEILDSEGNFYTENLRTARQRNTYVASGEGEEVFKPSFTWQGFQYIRLDEYPFEDVDIKDFTAVAIHSDMKRTGRFNCGNAKINQLYHNILWGQKSNFIDVPTDCPQRDERMGWTGDTQVFSKMAAINFDVEKFMRKWLRDLAFDQCENGRVHVMTPSNHCENTNRSVSGWGDAATVCPWNLYMSYGNREVLEEQFESMRGWVEYMRKSGEEEYLWLGHYQLGDWLAMDAGEGSYRGATPEDYVASAYYAYSTSLLIKAGKIIGKDVSEYEKLYDNIVKAFHDKFISGGVPVPKTQTAQAIALQFDLAQDREKTAKILADMVIANGNKLTTGFIGTPLLLHALSENGYSKTAYDLLLQEEFPSWLYSVNKGATTIWEHWDGVKEDGSFWSVDMNSFNHYAYGAVGDWLFGGAAGIKILEDGAGYKHISLAPIPDKRLGFVNAEIETRQGRVASSWYYSGENVHFEFEVPQGTTAEISLPDGQKETVCGGKHIFVVNQGNILL